VEVDMARVERFSISIDGAMLEDLDAWLLRHGHTNRSEAIRDLIRERLLLEGGPDQAVAASLTIVYRHGARELADHLQELGHDHHDLVMSTMHLHLDAERCMELSALRGSRAEVEHYAAHVIGVKGVLFGQVVVAAVLR
jgi:CopG family transcriptional regulator, nickel-responsive regulator